MSMDTDGSRLEQFARGLLLESLDRTDARVRSRLNRSRQAAVSVAAGRQRAWVRWALLPATGAACAAALAVVFMMQPASQSVKPLEAANALDVIDLVTDDDAMGLVENGDSSFYEWAAAQEGQAGGQSQRDDGSQGGSGSGGSI